MVRTLTNQPTSLPEVGLYQPAGFILAQPIWRRGTGTQIYDLYCGIIYAPTPHILLINIKIFYKRERFFLFHQMMGY